MSQEISRFMISLSELEAVSDESIYDQYGKLKQSMESLSKNLLKITDRENTPENKSLQKEISRLMESFDLIDFQRDESIYERYFELKSQAKKIARESIEKNATPKSAKIMDYSYIPLEDSHSIHPNNFWFVFSLLLITVVGIAVIYLMINAAHSNSTPQNTIIAENSQEKIVKNTPSSTPSGIPDEGKHQDSLVPKSTEKTSPLGEFLKTRPKTNDILDKLLEKANDQSFLPEDIVWLKRIYGYYSKDDNIKTAVLWCMASIQNEEVLEWMESIAENASKISDRVLAIETIGRYGNPACVKFFLPLLEKEQDTRVLLTACFALARVVPEDIFIYQTMVTKFYEIKDDGFQEGMVSCIASMKLPDRRFFFEDILKSTQYGFSLRVKSLEYLIEYANSSKQEWEIRDFLASLARFESDKMLQEKIRIYLSSKEEHE